MNWSCDAEQHDVEFEKPPFEPNNNSVGPIGPADVPPVPLSLSLPPKTAYKMRARLGRHPALPIISLSLLALASLASARPSALGQEGQDADAILAALADTPTVPNDYSVRYTSLKVITAEESDGDEPGALIWTARVSNCSRSQGRALVDCRG